MLPAGRAGFLDRGAEAWVVSRHAQIKRLHARLDELDAGKKDTTVVDAKDSAGSVKKDGDKKGSSSSSNQAHSGKGGKKK